MLHHPPYPPRQQPVGGNSQWVSSHSKRSTSSSSSDTSAILGHPRAPSSSSAAAVTAHAHQFDLPRPPRNHSQSTVPINCGLSDTDSSDDSTYSSQYQSDANSTPTTRQSNTLPRPLTGGGQGYGTRARHGAVRRAVLDDTGTLFNGNNELQHLL